MGTGTEILTGDRVNDVFMDCLFKEGEDATDHVVAEGVDQTVGFHPGRIDQHRQEIHDMLAELPDTFKSSGGRGWSFLNLCMDKNGNLWTGMHLTQDQLVLLGIAIGEVEYLIPREAWGVLPGGMPYLVVKQ